MSLKSKKELLFRMQSRYLEADRKQKSEIIDGFVAATGYHRKYAASVLSNPNSVSAQRTKTNRSRKYDEEVALALISVWNAANQICSKRLKPFLPEFIATLERFGHLSLPAEVRTKLLGLSTATMDRLLKVERTKHGRGISTTRPSNLLKQRIKIRTFADWSESTPGFFEADLVAHCGDHVDGSFLHTLVTTDIQSGWTEFIPLLRKCDSDVIAGLNTIRSVLPMAMRGLDTDNGCEFINYELLNYCESEKITFTRSRAYKKNDQAHVEQKNGNVIRRIVGYERFEGVETLTKLVSLYRVLRLYLNFFQPSCKLIKKTRVGSRTSKQYDAAKTPYQRLMESDSLSPATKKKLQETFAALDPLDLFEQLGDLQQGLWNLAVDEEKVATPRSPSPLLEEKNNVVAPESQTPRLLSLKPTRKFKRHYTKQVPHTWRTRVDPLEGTMEYARILFGLEPDITSPKLLQKLHEKYPDKITGKELRTLRRRLSEWRKESLKLTITTYESDTRYDALAFSDSLQNLTQKALKLEGS